MKPVVLFDQNVRVDGNRTYVGFEDFSRGDPAEVAVGDSVWIAEEEAGIAGEGTVYRVDMDARLIFLDVAWRNLKIMPIGFRSVAVSATVSSGAGVRVLPFDPIMLPAEYWQWPVDEVVELA